MATSEMDYMNRGGGEVEWITPTLASDNKSFTCEASFPIETLIIMYSASSWSCIYMLDKAGTLWYANTDSAKWQNAGDFSAYLSFSADYKTVTYTCAQNLPMSNVSVLLMANKPNGYYK